MIHLYIDKDNDPTLVIKSYSRAREIGSGSTEPCKAILDKSCISASHPQVSVPVGCQIPFSKLIYCTCIFPSLYLHSLPSFVSLLESLYLARLLNAERSASYKARASVLSRGSLGYRGISGPATPDVHTKIRTFVYVTITHNPKTNDGIIKSIRSTRVHKLL